MFFLFNRVPLSAIYITHICTTGLPHTDFGLLNFIQELFLSNYCYRHFLKALEYVVITNILALTIKLEATIFLCIHFCLVLFCFKETRKKTKVTMV